jgi:hypothetical protein
MEDYPEFYIKGYKIDFAKLEQTYGRRPNDRKYFLSIWKKFPLPFKYLETGMEADVVCMRKVSLRGPGPVIRVSA